MQTKTTALQTLEAIIEAADPTWNDAINTILSQFPAVWYTLFNNGQSDDGSEWTPAELERQAADAIESIKAMLDDAR